MFVGTMTSDCAARLTVTGAGKALLDAQRDLQHKRKGVFNREPPHRQRNHILEKRKVLLKVTLCLHEGRGS